MTINLHLSLRFVMHQDVGAPDVILCFRHAVREVTEHQRDIEVEVDDFTSEYDGRQTSCDECRREKQPAPYILPSDPTLKPPRPPMDEATKERLRKELRS